MTRLGCSPGLKGVLGVPSFWIGVPPDQCPAFYHNMALVSYLMSSWRVKKGVKMVDAFVRRRENLGGRVICEDAVKAFHCGDTQALFEGKCPHEFKAFGNVAEREVHTRQVA